MTSNSGTRTVQKLLFGIGGAVLLAGLLIQPGRALPIFLMASFLALTMSLAGLFFVALEQTVGAFWSASFRRVPEAMAATLPRTAAVFAVALAANLPNYPWFHGAHGNPQSPFWFKDLWLNPVFFASRSIFYLGVWVIFADRLLRRLRAQDAGWSDAGHRKTVQLSAAFVVVFGLTFCLAVFDWVMSFDPHWYSTIFGVYNFAGLMLAGLAMIAVLCIREERSGALRGAVTPEHLHDLGKLMFAFSSFWMYIWFSQYMLIWYANIPEETSYFIERMKGDWGPLLLMNLAVNWVVPFLSLLRVHAKREPDILVKVCWVILFGRCLDVYLMIMPQFGSGASSFYVWEAAALVAAGAGFLLLFSATFSSAPAVPRTDPRVAAAIHYHN